MRLIDADALVGEFEWLKSAVYPCNRDEVEDAIQRIKNAPTVDVVEVRHGKWVGRCGSGQYDDYSCSLCGMYEEGTRNRRLLGNYCSNCGAKMD